MKIWKHILVDTAVLAMLLTAPVLTSDYGRAVVAGTDAVSSATVIIDAPSGDYLVLLNLEKHPDMENRQFWLDFFSGAEVTYCFEDISCLVARSDSSALTMAQSLQSRLAEHQMTIRTEDMTLLLSKADYGKFDVIILSKEMAEHYHAQTAVRSGVTDILVRDTQEETV